MVSAVEQTWVVFRQAPVTCFGLVKASIRSDLGRDPK